MPDAAAPTSDALLRHAEFVHAVARAALRGDDLVDDVVQETWAAALEGGATRAERLRPWLGGVARRQAANLLRRRIAARERDRRAARPEAAPSTSSVAARAETGRRLVGAVLALEEPYRTAVLLRYYDDLPPREVARRTGVPVETARTHVKRGLKRLRTRLDEDAARRGRSAPALLLPLVEDGRPVVAAALPLVGGVLAMKKLALGLGILALALLGGYAVRVGVLARRSSPADPLPAEIAEAPKPPRLEGRTESEGPGESAVEAHSAERGRAGTTTFRGVVVDPDGNPIPGATVAIDRHPPWYFSRQGKPAIDPDRVAPATTDDAGRFRLEVPGGGGGLNVRAHAPGWVAAGEYGVGIGSQAESRIVMVPASPLDVTIRDAETGRPIEEAEVHGLVGVMARAYLVHPPWPLAVARTDHDGRARLALPEGRVRVLVDAPGYARSQEDGIALRPEGGAITLGLRRGGLVRGQVVDPSGDPVAFAEVHAFAPAAWHSETKTDSDGVFLLENTTPPLAGGYEVMARTHVVVRVRAAGWPRAWGALPAPGSGEEATVRVVLEPGRTLRGRVRMADGTEPPRGSVSLTVMDLGTREHYATTPTMHGAVDTSAGFVFEDLPAGEVELVLYRGTSWERTLAVDIPPDRDPDPVDVVLGGGVDLPVRVLDAAGDPVAAARVRPVRKDEEDPFEHPGEQQAKLTDGEGRLVLEGRDPVPTYVVVDAPGFGPEVRLVDLTKPPADLEVRLGAGTIEGRVVHPDGRPARVKLRLTRSIRLERYSTPIASGTRVETDAEGRFHFQRVGEGRHGIRVDSDELRLLSFGVRLHAGDTDARLVVATKHEASKLHVEALLVDAETLEPVEEALYVSIHPEGGRGSGMMERLSEPPGVYRSTEPHAPGTHTVRVQGDGWENGEAAARLAWGEETPRPRILLTRTR